MAVFLFLLTAPPTFLGPALGNGRSSSGVRECLPVGLPVPAETPLDPGTALSVAGCGSSGTALSVAGCSSSGTATRLAVGTGFGRSVT